MSNKNITLNGPLIQAQAIKYATMLQCLDFKASNGWLDGFKKRHNISFKTVVGEAGLVDTKVIEDWFKILPDLIKGYDWSDIFNADETALFLHHTNIKLAFFPPNCTSVCQPMDQGIIQSFKINYRRFLIEEKIVHIEQGSEMPEINVYSAINMINKAWIEVSVSTIQNCFKKGGFIKQYSENIVISEPDDMSEYSKSYKTLCTLQNSAFDFNQYAYVNIDKDLACCETVTDEEIIQKVNRNDLDEASSDEDEEEVQTTRSPIKNTEALIIIDKLRHYCASQKNDLSSVLASLKTLETQVHLNSKLTQTKIDSFFY